MKKRYKKKILSIVLSLSIISSFAMSVNAEVISKDAENYYLPSVEDLQRQYNISEAEAEEKLQIIINQEEIFKKEKENTKEINTNQALEKEKLIKEMEVNEFKEGLVKKPYSLKEKLEAKQYKEQLSTPSGISTFAAPVIYEKYGGSLRIIEMPFHQQETDYYCGPASVQMALHARGVYVWQSTLASSKWLNTVNTRTSSGLSMKDTLNAILNTTWYIYQNLDNVSYTTYEVEQRVKLNIMSGYVPIIATYQTGNYYNISLAGHNGKFLRHFIPIDGYDTGAVTGERELRYKDPVYGRANYPNVKREFYWISTELMRTLSDGGSMIY